MIYNYFVIKSYSAILKSVLLMNELISYIIGLVYIYQLHSLILPSAYVIITFNQL